jgi:hypothetical protein
MFPNNRRRFRSLEAELLMADGPRRVSRPVEAAPVFDGPAPSRSHARSAISRGRWLARGLAPDRCRSRGEAEMHAQPSWRTPGLARALSTARGRIEKGSRLRPPPSSARRIARPRATRARGCGYRRSEPRPRVALRAAARARPRCSLVVRHGERARSFEPRPQNVRPPDGKQRVFSPGRVFVELAAEDRRAAREAAKNGRSRDPEPRGDEPRRREMGGLMLRGYDVGVSGIPVALNHVA